MAKIKTYLGRTTRYLTLTTLFAGAALPLTGCSPFNYTKPDAPTPLQQIAQINPEPKIALVLGAGGPRGYAHIGVMRVLENAGIHTDLVVGSSVGSLIGVFWASGLTASEIDALSLTGGPLTVFDPSPFADRGWIHGQRLQNYVNNALNGKQLQELPRRVIVVATHRTDKSPRFFVSGNSGVAVRASSAMPGIISPVGIKGIEYEDGDVSLPLAVSAARSAGASFVIAVNVYPRLESTPSDASAESRARNEHRHRLIAPEVAKADFLIHPDTPYRASPRKRFFVSARSIGEKEARSRLPELLEALKKHRNREKKRV